MELPNWNAIDVLSTSDVIVNGGGIGGVACAVSLAEVGYRVAVVERRGSFGWEIGRARRVFLDLERAAAHADVAAEIHRRLAEHGGYSGGVIHAPIAELIFDRMLVEREVEPLFHAWPIAVTRDGTVPRGLVVGTKEGYGLIEAPVIVETDESGRLVDRSLRAPIDGAGIGVKRSFVLDGVDVAAMRDRIDSGDLGDLLKRLQIDVHPINDRLVQVDACVTQEDYSERERALPSVVRRTTERLRACDAVFASAGVVYIADDEWSRPPFTLHVAPETGGGLTADQSPVGELLTDVDGSFKARGISPQDLVTQEGVVLAGPWLPRAIHASNTEEVAVLNRICIGEAAARMIQRAADLTQRETGA